MPYLVSTKRPCPACQYGPNAGGEHRPESVSRVAVGALEEAHCLAHDLAKPGPRGERHHHQAALLIPEVGGTVGPLPDGSLIEVERVADSAILDALGWPSDSPMDLALAAFNEANR